MKSFTKAEYFHVKMELLFKKDLVRKQLNQYFHNGKHTPIFLYFN